jgi:predicted ATP-dependent serine protease
MEQEKQPIAFLFEEVAVYKPEDIDNLIDNLTEEQAKFMLIKSVQMAYKHGIYSLTESEVLSKSLRILK